ncbi:ABC transporter permease [Flavobacteriaceae bacterium 3-367]
MWSNFVKIAHRKLWKQKGSSFTKLFSLSVGIVSLFYIGIYMHQELAFDTFHRNYERIVKINTSIMSPTGDLSLGLTAAPLGPYLSSVAPEVEALARINKEYGSHSIRKGERLFSESENIFYADPGFFTLFDFDLVSGNKNTALDGPNKVIITERMAQKYFGSTDVLNKVLYYDDKPFTVSGLIQKMPARTHLQFDFLISMATFFAKSDPNAAQNWTWLPMNTYLLLNKREQIAQLEDRLKTIPQYLEENQTNDRYSASLEPLDGLHFSAPKLGELGPKGKRSDLYLLLAIGIMILLLAISNFINLTTAQVDVQGKEVSVKKTIGASKKDIFKQFFAESLLLTSLATVLSVGGILGSVPYFGHFMGAEFNIEFLLHPITFILLPLVPLVLSLLGGIYPALKFSNIASVPVLKSKETKYTWLNTRSSLLVFQFSITSALIIGSLLILKQLNFMQDQELGIDMEQKIVLDYGPNSGIGNAFEALKEELGAVPGVNRISFSSHVPGQVPNGVSTQIRDVKGRTSNGEINLNLVDQDFIKNYGLQVVAGRDFRKGENDLTTSLILNEAAVKAFGYENPMDILGASFEQWGGNGTVIGVVKDFNYMSLHEDVGLLSLKIWPQQFMKITMQLGKQNFEETLQNLKSKWASLYPNIPFTYYFADDHFRAQYDKDKQFAGVVSLFTVVSVCMGILGLIAYATFWCARRRKEMSIRKVLGAQVPLLIWKLYKGFSIPVLIGFMIAVPVAYYLGAQWLEQFAFRFQIRWHFFALPLLLLLVFVWMAVGMQTLQVVQANPVDNLKEE